MASMKRGTITQMNRNQNFGIIREDTTLTEWIFYFDELSKEQLKEMRVYTSVEFKRDELYEQFVATDITIDRNQLHQAV